jgi:murein DD-endopeptidase MepM/ murein hydrolase activator NlpD
MVRRAGTNSPSGLTGSNVGVDLPDYANENWEQVIQNTQAGFGHAAQALDAQAQVFNQEYQRKVQEWKTKEEQRLAESQSGGGGIGEIGQALAGIGKQLLAGYTLQEEIKFKNTQQAKENDWRERSVRLNEKEFDFRQNEVARQEQARQAKAEQDYLTQIWEAKLTETQSQINEYIGQYGRANGVQAAKQKYNEFLGSPEYQALPEAVKFDIALKANKQLEELTGESADKIYEEQTKIKEEAANTGVQQFKLEYSAGLQRLRTGTDLTADEAIELSQELLYGGQTLVQNSPQLQASLSDPRVRLQYQAAIVKEVGDSLNSYYGTTGQQGAEAQNFILAANELRALEAFRDSGEINDAQYQAKAKEVLLSRGIQTDPDKMPNAGVQIMDAKIKNLEQRNQYTELLQRDRNLETILGEKTPQGQALVRRNIGTSLYNNINGRNVEVRIAELRNLERNNPNVAQAVHAPAEREMLEGYHKDRTRLAELNQSTASLEAEIHKLGYAVNPPKAKEYTVDPNTPLGMGQGVAAQPEVILIPAPNRVPEAPIEALEAKREQLAALYQERDIVMYRWKQYGVNLANPSDQSYLKQLEADTQASADEIARRSAAEGIGGNLDPSMMKKNEPTRSDVDRVRIDQGVIGDLQRSGKTAVYLPQNTGNKELDEQIKSEYGNSLKNVVQLTLAGQYKEAEAFIKYHVSEVDKKLSPSAKGTKESISLRNNLTLQKQELQRVYEYTKEKQQWYRQKFEGQSRPAERPVSNFSKGSATPPQRVLPENEAMYRPAMPMSGNLATSPQLGYVPFKGGNVRVTSQYEEKRGDKVHRGLDLVSDDPRVATVQGGTVVFAGEWSTYGNVVMVKTQDGHTEVYAHLDKLGVRKGDTLTPAQQVGIMGNTGRSKGAHLHFEVWTADFKDHPSEVKERGYVSPVDYLQRFQGKATMPVGGGVRNSTKQQVSYTGAVKMSENLVYSNGYIIDRNTMQMRKATPRDDLLIQNGVPLADRRNVPQTATYLNSPAGKSVTYYEPPAEAATKQHYVFVRPAGYKDKNGKDVFYLEGYDKGRRVFSKPVTDGKIPDGSYKVNSTGSSVTGNVSFYDERDKNLVSQFIKRRNGTDMYVSTIPKQKYVQSGINDYTGKPMSSNALSIYKEDYAPSNPDDDYGVKELRDDARLRQSYHNAAKKLGVPTVWLVDQTLGESGLNKAVEGGRNNDYIGLIQMGDAALHDVGMYLEGRPYTKEDVRNHDIYWQIEVLIPAYFEVQLKQAKAQGNNRGIQTYEDMLMLVWGGAGGYNRSLKSRETMNDYHGGGGVNWQQYRENVVTGGRKLGRRYAWSHKQSVTLHAAPRDNCPVCQGMNRSGSFTSHYYYG